MEFCIARGVEMETMFEFDIYLRDVFELLLTDIFNLIQIGRNANEILGEIMKFSQLRIPYRIRAEDHFSVHQSLTQLHFTSNAVMKSSPASDNPS
jgi:hypothetical protein